MKGKQGNKWIGRDEGKAIVRYHGAGQRATAQRSEVYFWVFQSKLRLIVFLFCADKAIICDYIKLRDGRSHDGAKQ